MNREKSARKKAYKFHNETRELAIRKANYLCECCGTKLNKKDSKKAEIHHLLPIWVVADYCPKMSAIIVRSLTNAVVLCHDCHFLLHKKEKKFKSFYKKLIVELESLDNFFQSIDLSPKLSQKVLLFYRGKRKSMLNILREEI